MAEQLPRRPNRVVEERLDWTDHQRVKVIMMMMMMMIMIQRGFCIHKIENYFDKDSLDLVESLQNV